MAYRALVLLAAVSLAAADYDCVCNYNVEESVRSSPSSSAPTIGYMYEFDCKQNIPMPSLDPGWLAVAYEHKLGYVNVGSAVQKQTCQGSPPVEDLVTTTVSPTTTTTSTTTISTTVPVTTTKSITVATKTTTTMATTTPRPTTETTTKQTTTHIQKTTTSPKPTTTTTQSTTPPTTITTSTTFLPTSISTSKQLTISVSTTPDPAKTTTTTTTTKTTPPTSKTTTQSPTTNTQTTADPCATVRMHHASLVRGILTHYLQNCYEFVTSAVTWPSAEKDCNKKGGHLAHIANVGEQNFIYQYLKSHQNHRVWIGLTDKRNEERFEWTSGDPVVYTNWSPTRYDLINTIEDCVELDPNNSGFWKDKDCQTVFQAYYGYVCQYRRDQIGPVTTATFNQPTSTRAPSNSADGNTHLCRPLNVQHSQTRGTRLAQHGSSCYELMPTQKVTWEHAERYCETGRGHLVHISSASDQAFVQSFVKRYLPNNAVWIGLHDLNVEGRYEWTSGNRVSFTNFVHGHIGNFVNRYKENCFVLIPYKNGLWDDIPCGDNDFLGNDYGEQHYMLCQFPLATSGIIG